MALTKRARRRLLLLGGLVASLAILAVGAFLFVRWRSERILQGTLARGLEAFDDGRYEDALAALGPLLRQMQDDHRVVFAVAKSRYEIPEQDQGHLLMALRLFRRAAELREDDLESRELLLDLYPRQGFLREMLDTADEILDLEPTHPEALAARARGLAAMGRWSDASIDAASLVRLYPNQERWKQMQVSMALASGQAAEEVVLLTEQWPPADPPDGLNDLIRAALLASMGRSEGTSESIGRGVRAGAGSLENLQAMVSMLTDLGRADDARDLIDRFGETQGRTAAWADLASRWAFDQARGDLLLRWIEEASNAGSTLSADAAARAALVAIAVRPEAVADTLRRLDGQSGDAALLRRMIEGVRDLRTRVDMSIYRDLVVRADAARSSPLVNLALAQAAIAVGDLATARSVAARDAEQARTLQALLVRAEIELVAGRLVEAMGLAADAAERHPTRAEPQLLLVDAWTRLPSVPEALRERAIRITGARTSLEAATRLHDALGGGPLTARMLVRAASVAGRSNIAEDVVIASIASDSVDADQLFALLAELRTETDLRAMILRRIREVAPQDPRVLLSEGVEEPVADLRERLPLDAPAAGVRLSAWLVLLQAAGRESDDAFVAVAEEALDRNPDQLRLLNALLADGRVWRSQELVDRLVRRLSVLLGEASDQVVVARANWVLAFRSDDAEALASALRQVNDLFAADSESLTAGLTLLRLLQADASSDPMSAVRLGRRLVARNPEAFEIYPLLIGLLQRQGMLEESDRYLRQFEAIDRAGVLSGRQRAAQQFEEGDFGSLVLTLTGLSDRSGAVRDLLVLAQAQEANQQWAEAEATYRRALESADAPWETVSRLAGLLTRRGRLPDAQRVVAEHGERFPAAIREVILGELMLQAGDAANAERRFAAAVAADPSLIGGWRLLAAVREQMGRGDDAVTAAFRGLAIDPSDEILQSLVVGSVLRDRTIAETTLRSAQQTAGLSGVFVDCLRLLIATAGPDGRLQPDAAQLRRARDLCGQHPTSLIAWRTAVALHDGAGAVGEARSLAAAAAQRFPDAVEPMSWQVRLAAAQGNLGEAVQLCREWRRRAFPEVREVDQAQAIFEIARNRPEVALELLRPHQEAIVAAASDEPGPYRALLASLIMNGSVREALRLEGPRLRESAQSRAVWARFAGMAPYTPGYEAMTALEAATPSDLRSRAVLVGEWVAFHDRHPNGNGLAKARSVMAAPSGEPSTYEERLGLVSTATVAAAAGAPGDARRMLQRVIDSYSGDARARARAVMALPPEQRLAAFEEFEPLLYALNNYAMNLVEEQIDLRTALRLVDEAIEILPSEPNLLDTRAQVLLGLGRIADAEQAVLGAIRFGAAANPEVRLTAVQVLLADGRTADAVEILRQVREGVTAEPWPPQKLLDRLGRLERQARD